MKNSEKVQRVKQHLVKLDKDIEHQLKAAKGQVFPIVAHFNNEFAKVDPSTSVITNNVIVQRKAVCDDVQGEWIYTPKADTRNRILFVHGGGWCSEEIESYRALAARISLATSCCVLLVKYRVPPKHPMPNGLSDCLACYTKMLTKGPNETAEANAIFLLADSTGANMSLALLFLARERNIKLPNSVVLLSPITDCEFIKTVSDISTFNCVPLLNESLNSYLTLTSKLTEPLVSPVNGVLDGLPEMLIQVSSLEKTINDVKKFVSKATKANIEITFQIWSDVPHTFQKFAPFLNQANEAIENIGKFVSRTMPRKIIPFPEKQNKEPDNAVSNS